MDIFLPKAVKINSNLTDVLVELEVLPSKDQDGEGGKVRVNNSNYATEDYLKDVGSYDIICATAKVIIENNYELFVGKDIYPADFGNLGILKSDIDTSDPKYELLIELAINSLQDTINFELDQIKKLS